jgi:outer membrane protein assembly factor BamB
VSEPNSASSEPIDGGKPSDSARGRAWLIWFPIAVIFLTLAIILGLPMLPEHGSILDHDYVRRAISIILGMFSGLLLVLWYLVCGPSVFSSRLGVVLAVGVACFAFFMLAIRKFEITGNLDITPEFVWNRPRADIVAEHRKNRNAVSGTLAENIVVDDPADYPAYRGRNRDGILDPAGLNLDWKSKPPKPLWKQPVGLGYSAFVTIGPLAITNEQRGSMEAVVAYEIETGRQVWIHEAEGRFTEAMGGEGPRATPTISGGLVYNLGANGRLDCLDARTGAQKWNADTLKDAGRNLTWAMSGAPLVWKNLVIVNPGVNGLKDSAPKGTKGRGVLAFDRLSGKEVWAAGDHPAGYASPVIAKLHDRETLVIFDGHGLALHDPESGRELTRVEWKTNEGINVAQPLFPPGNRVFVSSGYGVGSGLFEVTIKEGVWGLTEKYRGSRFHCRYTSPVMKDGYAWGLDEGILACVRIEDGARQWKGGRYKNGQISLAGDTLIVLGEDGILRTVAADPKAHRELAKLPAVEGKSWNCFAVARGRLLVRNHLEMACFDLSDGSAPGKTAPPANPTPPAGEQKGSNGVGPPR